MCSKCVDAVREVFPEYADDDRFINFILWEKSAFPFVHANYVREQIIQTRGTIFIDGEGI